MDATKEPKLPKLILDAEGNVIGIKFDDPVEAAKFEQAVFKEPNPIFKSCTALREFLESYGAKAIWPPTKFRKQYIRLQPDVQPAAGRKILIGVVPSECDEWSDLSIVTDDETFLRLRHRPFYAPSTLWFEFNFGTKQAESKYVAWWTALMTARARESLHMATPDSEEYHDLILNIEAELGPDTLASILQEMPCG